jgi:hypothetical protein
MKEGGRARDRVDFNNDEYYMRYEELMREGGVIFLEEPSMAMHVIKIN